MTRRELLHAIETLAATRHPLPAEALELARKADLGTFAATELTEAARFFYDWGLKEQRVRQRHTHRTRRTS